MSESVTAALLLATLAGLCVLGAFLAIRATCWG